MGMKWEHFGNVYRRCGGWDWDYGGTVSGVRKDYVYFDEKGWGLRTSFWMVFLNG